MLVVGCGGIAENDIALLTQAIAFFGPRLAMVLYSVLDQAVMAACARAGVAGYLPKASSPDALAARSAWSRREANAIRSRLAGRAPPRRRWSCAS